MPAGVTEGILRRIYGEFVEMPGMQLTARQAGRLWDLDERTCDAALSALVDAEFLLRTSEGTYRRRTDGAVAFPSTRMLQATPRSSHRSRRHAG
jgi:hypothetical protein